MLPDQPPARSTVWDTVAVIVFAVGIVGWACISGFLVLVFDEWKRYPRAGDAAIGIFLLAVGVLFMSMCALAASIILAFLAKRLPKWFLIISILSPALGVLVGLVLFYRAFGG